MDDISSCGSDRDGSPLLGRRRDPAPSEPTYSINPVLGENDSESSAFLRRKEAASGGIGRYESLGDVDSGEHKQREGKGIAENEADNSWTQLEVPHHKREEHATTYVNKKMTIS